ncbi:hypothetical protein BGZ51_002516 [Haplosporangium sp. Z 767]|nr:hypothetical protein BGZ51_002516 [Haplosporangium sp. Z 767]
MKRSREWTTEETQAQYLDQIEEYQWNQTMAVRTLLQQQQLQQQQHEQQLQLQFELQLQQLETRAHPQQYPTQQQQSHQQQQPILVQQQLQEPIRYQEPMTTTASSQFVTLPSRTAQQPNSQQPLQPTYQSSLSPTPSMSTSASTPMSSQPQRIYQQQHIQGTPQGAKFVSKDFPGSTTIVTSGVQQAIFDSSWDPQLRQQQEEYGQSQQETRERLSLEDNGTSQLQQQMQQQQKQQSRHPQGELNDQLHQTRPIQRGSNTLHINNNMPSLSTPKPLPSIPSFPYFPPAIQKYSPELSPAPSDGTAAAGTEAVVAANAASSTGSARLAQSGKGIVTSGSHSGDPQLEESCNSSGKRIDGGVNNSNSSNSNNSNNNNDNSRVGTTSTGASANNVSNDSTIIDNQSKQSNKALMTTPPPLSAQPQSRSNTTHSSVYKKTEGSAGRKSIILRVPFPARAPPPPKSVAQLEEAMMDLKIYDSCLFWPRSGAVNLKPEGNSWDDDMVLQSKDPAWVRNFVQPAMPTNQELLILPPIAKIERAIEVFFNNSHLFPPFVTRLIVERARQTRSDLISRILLSTIAGIAARIDPDFENTSNSGAAKEKSNTNEDDKMQYMRYFNRAYGLLAHLEDIRSTYSTTYLQASLLLCYVYPKPQLRVELLKLMSEAAFLGLYTDASRWMPKPIVIQNRCWLFWACYMFDSVHHVVRGQLTQLDEHYMDPPFPVLSELDHDDGLWTRWFMLKEVNLWRIGRKIHSFFQAGLKRMDRQIDANDRNACLLSSQDILANEYSEAELMVSLKMWTDDLPLRLQAELERFDQVEPRVNGRAVGLQVVYSMLRILLLYPNMLAVGTGLLDISPPRVEGNESESEIALQQHFKQRQEYLDRIMQCIQEADRVVVLSTIVLDRYPERASMSCLGAVLDWCLRIYHKIVTEERQSTATVSTSATEGESRAENQSHQQHTPSSSAGSFKINGSLFSSRLKARCRGQVGKVATLLKRYEDLDHRYYYSWLTTELGSLEDHQKTIQQRLIQKCLDTTEGSVGQHTDILDQNSSLPMAGILLSQQPPYPQYQQQQKQKRWPKSHDLQTIIRKRQEMGIYANSGIQPNGGNYSALMSNAPSSSWSSSLPLVASVASTASSGLPYSTTAALMDTGIYSGMSMTSGTEMSGYSTSQPPQPVYHFEYHTQSSVTKTSSSSTTYTSQQPLQQLQQQQQKQDYQLYRRHLEQQPLNMYSETGMISHISNQFFGSEATTPSSVVTQNPIQAHQQQQQQQQQQQHQQQHQQQQHSRNHSVHLDSFFG